MLNLPLETLFIGRTFLSLPQCQSTNTELLYRLANPAEFGVLPEGYVLQTDDQTAGRGQRGNQWEASPGQNLTFSLLLRPHFLAVSQQFSLTISISLAIFDLLTELPLAEVEIKWPNDIYVNGLKVGGVLVENSIKGGQLEASVVGIGLNLNQTRFTAAQASSLKLESGLSFNREELLTRLLKQLEARYLQLRCYGNCPEQCRQQYHAALLGYQSWRAYRAGSEIFSAKIVEVEAGGRLVLLDKAGQSRYYSLKEVEFLNDEPAL